ncbi:adenosylcobinamide-GDP ribazoletransferase [Salipiger sp. PrR002]|uniref:adenosylcobinamide-GDP ribazoletransferase n=1 Tax=Salipiger sp. PrR002 TaxID=2706489 RepID=UPI0013B8D356|nr:adenosylcobinamide-GDP ribazoletransferase [Salipiger sp. PrR002]NDW00349.1 adenosylcobinamide-GDP ribazoletransferase [Salipiger sp. PrR002]NDW59437.1 adenosylcobinamide-GDP ribazoletransferase [Salipiger sp. PrR004]
MSALRALGRRRRELQVAVMLLTRLPAGRLLGDAPALREARWAFPLVGALVGLIGWAVFAGALAAGGSGLLAALLCLTITVLVTGALHFDGLADFADGIGGGRDRAHTLEIMRDSRIGSYGVMALILASGLWTAALADLEETAGPLLFMVIGALSRGAMSALQESLPPARADGMGHLAAGRSRAGQVALLVAVLLSVLVAGLAGLAIVAVCAGVALALGTIARRRLGGVTGDVLGAAQLLSEVAAWVLLAVLLPG